MFYSITMLDLRFYSVQKYSFYRRLFIESIIIVKSAIITIRSNTNILLFLIKPKSFIQLNLTYKMAQNESLPFTPSPYTKQKEGQSELHVESFTTSQKLKQFISHDHDYLAYFLQAAACFVWTCSYIYSNQNDLDIFQINLSRGFVGFFFNYFFLTARGSQLRFQQSRIFKGLLKINLYLLSYFYMLPLSQLYLPLPIVHTIGCSSMIAVYIMDYFMNGIKITRNGLIGIVFAVAGVLIISNDRIILSVIDSNYKFESQFTNYRQQSALVFLFISLALLSSRIINSYGTVLLKSYPQISVFELNFHSSILGIISGAIGYMTKQTHRSFSVFWPSIITIGVGQSFCMTMYFYSLKLTKKTGNVMIINGSNIIFAFLISSLRYGQKINIILIVGSVSLFTSMAIVIMQTIKIKAQQKISSVKALQK